MKAPGRVVTAQIEKGLPGMGRGRVGQVVNAPFIEGTRLATSHGVMVKNPGRSATLDQYLGEGEATAARGSRWAGRRELDLLASRGGGGADGMVGREDRESVRERDVGQGSEVSFVVSVFEEKR